MLRQLVLKNRSYRRYNNSHVIKKEELLELIDLARMTPSARNLQPLKYMISNNPERNTQIFSALKWAGYLKDGGIDIEEKERPSAYIIILGDRDITTTYNIDIGIAAQTILLGAVEKGLGGCIIGTVNKELLLDRFNIPDRFEILVVIALGKPVEKVELETMQEGNVKYWRDHNNIHHVPKRVLKEIVLDI